MEQLLQWGALFQRGGDNRFQAPPGQRPAGPIALSGAAWMTAAYIPWILYWITFGSFGFSPLVSIGVPLALSGGIVAYRLRYNRPDWLELGGLAFFSLGGVGVVFPAAAGVFTVLRYLTLVPAYAFTGAYPKVGLQKPPKNTDLALGRLGWVSAASLVIAVAALVFTVLLRS